MSSLCFLYCKLQALSPYFHNYYTFSEGHLKTDKLDLNVNKIKWKPRIQRELSPLFNQ